MTCGRQTVAVPSTVHCDPFDTGKVGAKKICNCDRNKSEVYDFLGSFLINMDWFLESRRWYHSPGSLENMHFRGMMIGTDSHTPNAVD
jgi:aconitate hydratase